MKKCSKCGQDKPLSEYYNHPSCKGGKAKSCKVCYNEKQKKYYAENKQERVAYQKEWNAKNPEYHHTRKAVRRAQCRKWPLTDKELENIRGLYRLAKTYRLITGEPWEVDHIVPLKGDGVCGLHVPWNLQVVPKAYNQKKGARYNSDGGVWTPD